MEEKSKLKPIEIVCKKFKTDCEAFECRHDIDKNINLKSYYISYLEFLEHFKKIDKFEKHDVIIGIHLIYGWMPTICHLKSVDFAEAANILNKVKKDEPLLTEEELDRLKKVFNNSIVGTSKLLHFINPENYPIWDSNVCRYLNIPAHKANNIDVYLQYIDACRNIIEQCKDEITRVKEAMNEFEPYKVQNKISDMRAVELVMFTNRQRILKSSPQLDH
jgi:hypothetical protein